MYMFTLAVELFIDIGGLRMIYFSKKQLQTQIHLINRQINYRNGITEN